MNYKKIDSQDISYLKTAVSPDRVFTGEEISEDYGHDELGGVFSMPEDVYKRQEDISQKACDVAGLGTTA